MNEKKKICFKCGRELPISEFYSHPAMRDGHLNKCKECTRNDSRKRYLENVLDNDWLEKERARGREKYARLHYKENYKNKHNENKNTRRDLEQKGLRFDGFELHHWNYNEKNDVIPLTPSEHKRIHKRLVFDESTKMFRYNGNLLETRQEHQEAILDILLDI